MSSRTSSGLRAWMIQRISAVYLAGFLLFICFYLTINSIKSWAEWHAWVAQPAVNVALGLFFVALLMHAWIGMRDVVMDYVKPFTLRLLLLIVIGAGLAAMGIWLARVLIMVML